MFLCWLRWRGLSQCPFWGQYHPTQQVNCLQVCCWLETFTRNVSAICIMLSVSAELLKLCIRNKFLWIAFSAASLVEILLVVSHPVSAWIVLGDTMWACPPVLCIYHGVAILILSVLNYEWARALGGQDPSSWLLIWYNRRAKTSLSPSDSVMNVHT